MTIAKGVRFLIGQKSINLKRLLFYCKRLIQSKSSKNSGNIYGKGRINFFYGASSSRGNLIAFSKGLDFKIYITRVVTSF